MATGAALALGCFSRLSWPVRIVVFYLALIMAVGRDLLRVARLVIGLVLAVAALVVFGLRHGTMRWWLPVTAALLLLAVCVGLFMVSPIGRARAADISRLAQGGSSAGVRIELAHDALRIAHNYPVFGTGPGTFTFIHPRYQGSTFALKAVLTHDDYLNCLDDYGLVGFALAIFFVAAVTLKFFRPLDIDNRWQERVVAATGFAAWLALLAHSWVDFNLHIPANARMLFALTGLALGRFKDESAGQWLTLSLAWAGRGLGGAVIVLGLVYGALVVRMGASDIVYETAFGVSDEVPVSESMAAARRALAFDPTNPQALTFLGDLWRYKAAREAEMADRINAAGPGDRGLPPGVADRWPG